VVSISEEYPVLHYPTFGFSSKYFCVRGRDIWWFPAAIMQTVWQLLKSRWVASYGPAHRGQTASNSKQSTWDKPGVLAESAAVEETRTSPFQRACLLAAHTPHSGDWLLALPITACGLRLDDEAVSIAVALRLGSELGSPHSCRCGSLVDATSTHGLAL